MKLLFSLSFILFSILVAEAGTSGATENNNIGKPISPRKDSIVERIRPIHIGFGSGINNSSGILGANVEFNIPRNGAVFGAAGLGSWGFKVSGGARYYFHFPHKAAIGLGYSYCTGLSNFTSNQEVINNSTGEISQQSVIMNLKPCGTINLTFLYFWKLGKHNRINIEAGYAVPTENTPYQVTSGQTLSTNSKAVMKFIQPGGFIIGAAFTFGVK